MSEDNNNAETIVVLLGCVAAFLVLPICIIFNGWVVSILWSWFAVKIFAVQPLTLWQSAGVCTLAQSILPNLPQKAKGQEVDSSYGLLTGVIRPFVCLAIGWFIHLFV